MLPLNIILVKLTIILSFVSMDMAFVTPLNPSPKLVLKVVFNVPVSLNLDKYGIAVPLKVVEAPDTIISSVERTPV